MEKENKSRTLLPRTTSVAVSDISCP